MAAMFLAASLAWYARPALAWSAAAGAQRPALRKQPMELLQVGTSAMERLESSASRVNWELQLGPWRRMAKQGSGASRNLCMRGKQVPDFYVLGVQKCATSSLANDLVDAGVSNVHGDQNPKEFHFFDHRLNYSLTGREGFETNLKHWLSWMPNCPGEENGKPSTFLSRLRRRLQRVPPPPRKALADFTPDYLRVVPMPKPDELKAVGGGWLSINEENRSMPARLLEFYGKEWRPKLRFAVMIREPLSQMQSAWYHGKSFNFENGCKSCKAASFQAALGQLVEGFSHSPPRITAWLWTVLYARQLEHWFDNFSPSQFIIIPERQYTRGDKDAVCRHVSREMSFSINCNSHGARATHAWSHPHPSLDEDAPKWMRAKFYAFMKGEEQRLVRLLAKAHSNGLAIAGFQASAASEATLGQWLSTHW